MCMYAGQVSRSRQVYTPSAQKNVRNSILQMHLCQAVAYVRCSHMYSIWMHKALNCTDGNDQAVLPPLTNCEHVCVAPRCRGPPRCPSLVVVAVGACMQCVAFQNGEYILHAPHARLGAFVLHSQGGLRKGGFFVVMCVGLCMDMRSVKECVWTGGGGRAQ